MMPPEEQQQEQQDNRQIARAAGMVMIGFVLSSLAGLLRQVLIANQFGTQGLIDTFYAATVLPDTLFALVAGGALASAFIPTFTGLLANQDREGAWTLASSVGNLVFVVLTVLSAVAWFFAPPIVERLIAPDFSPAQQILTAEMLRILLLSQIILGVSGLLMGILNSHQSFLLPALAPTFYWLGIIFGLLFFVPGMGIHGLAWGTVLGAGLHLGIQLPGLFRLPGRGYRFSLGLDNPNVRLVGRLIAPRLLGAAVVHLNFWVGSNLASGMVEGSLTAFKNAYMVMMMPQAIIAQSISIAALPTLSAQFATEKLSLMRSSFSSARARNPIPVFACGAWADPAAGADMCPCCSSAGHAMAAVSILLPGRYCGSPPGWSATSVLEIIVRAFMRCRIPAPRYWLVWRQ